MTVTKETRKMAKMAVATKHPELFPEGVSAYRATPWFDEGNLPGKLRGVHDTKAGVWGVIEVERGVLRYSVVDGAVALLTPERGGLVRPQEAHRVEFVEPGTRFRVVFGR